MSREQSAESKYCFHFLETKVLYFFYRWYPLYVCLRHQYNIRMSSPPLRVSCVAMHLLLGPESLILLFRPQHAAHPDRGQDGGTLTQAAPTVLLNEHRLVITAREWGRWGSVYWGSAHTSGVEDGQILGLTGQWSVTKLINIAVSWKGRTKPWTLAQSGPPWKYLQTRLRLDFFT